jgi:hypothetical protein
MHFQRTSRHASSGGTRRGETSGCLHSGEGRPVSVFIVTVGTVLHEQGQLSRYTCVRFPVGGSDVIFLFATASRPALGPTQPPIRSVPGALPPGGGAKRLGREADHSPPSSGEVKNAWSYTFTPQ